MYLTIQSGNPASSYTQSWRWTSCHPAVTATHLVSRLEILFAYYTNPAHRLLCNKGLILFPGRSMTKCLLISMEQVQALNADTIPLEKTLVHLHKHFGLKYRSRNRPEVVQARRSLHSLDRSCEYSMDSSLLIAFSYQNISIDLHVWFFKVPVSHASIWNAVQNDNKQNRAQLRTNRPTEEPKRKGWKGRHKYP